MLSDYPTSGVGDDEVSRDIFTSFYDCKCINPLIQIIRHMKWNRLVSGTTRFYRYLESIVAETNWLVLDVMQFSDAPVRGSFRQLGVCNTPTHCLVDTRSHPFPPIKVTSLPAHCASPLGICTHHPTHWLITPKYVLYLLKKPYGIPISHIENIGDQVSTLTNNWLEGYLLWLHRVQGNHDLNQHNTITRPYVTSNL